VKKTSAEESAEREPAAKPSKTRDGVAGSGVLAVILTYLVLTLVLVVVIYYLTKIGTDTFRIKI